MVQFEDGQFEIAIATYNRPEFVETWLEKCYEGCVSRNIALSVYDSSTNKDTEEVIEKYNKNNPKKIKYHHVDEKTIIGYKPMFPLLNSESEYVWVSGDSRYHDFEELDQKVFPYIKDRSIDYCVINIYRTEEYKRPDTVYTDLGKMLHDIFVATTCIGLSIYRTEVFKPVREDPELLKKYDDLFKENYGFAWLGYFYNLFAMGNYKALLVDAQIKEIPRKNKVQSWAKRFYGCWVFDLFQIIDNIPDSYAGKETVPKETWKALALDSISYCYSSRKHADLNKTTYNELVSGGFLSRITDKPGRIKRFATAPLFVIELIYFFDQIPNRVSYYLGAIKRRLKALGK